MLNFVSPQMIYKTPLLSSGRISFRRVFFFFFSPLPPKPQLESGISDRLTHRGKGVGNRVRTHVLVAK